MHVLPTTVGESRVCGFRYNGVDVVEMELVLS